MSKTNIITGNIPNLFTSINLLCGLISILFAIAGGDNLVIAGYMIYIAAVFDFFDGFSARLLKAGSKLGKELDSLADLVSFGIAPSIILYIILKSSLRIKQFSFSLPTLDFFILLTPMLVAIFSAIRLAKFNIDDKQKEVFLGLATPASAMLVASIPLISHFDTKDLVLFPMLDKNTYFFVGAMMMGAYIVKPVVIVSVSILLSFLLVVNLPMFSLKFKSYRFEDNALKYIFLIISVILFAIVQVLAVPMIFILYFTFSIFDNLLNRNLQKRRIESNLDRLFKNEVGINSKSDS